MTNFARELLGSSPRHLVETYNLAEDFAEYSFAWPAATRLELLNLRIVPSFLQLDPMIDKVHEQYTEAGGKSNPRGAKAALALRRHQRELVDSGAASPWVAYIGAGVLHRVVEEMPHVDARDQLRHIKDHVRIDLADNEPPQGVLIVPEGLVPWQPTTVLYGGKRGAEVVGSYVESLGAPSSWSTDPDTLRERSGIVRSMGECALSAEASLALIGSI